MMTWPIVAMVLHIRRQGTLLDRIRAHFAIASICLTGDDRDGAQHHLTLIRRLERLWRFGASSVYLWALRSYILSVNVALGVIFSATSFYLNDYRRPAYFSDAIDLIKDSRVTIILTLALAFFYGIAGASSSWRLKDRRWIDHYGAQLETWLRAGRGLADAPQHRGPKLSPAGANALELLGVNPGFTKLELRRAWARLARELHPDRWMRSGEAVRKMKEEALKRVNVAYDELIPAAK